MNLIVAVDENWGIGKDNDLLYHLPEDMKFFRKTTIEKNVICGKNTLLSFPGSKPLPKRHHFVLTHFALMEDALLTRVSSLEELFEKIKGIPEDDLFVIGGESVYRQLYKKCKKAFVTKIFANEVKADTFFPNLDEDPDFVLKDAGEVLKSENGISFSFTIYENKNL